MDPLGKLEPKALSSQDGPVLMQQGNGAGGGRRAL